MDRLTDESGSTRVELQVRQGGRAEFRVWGSRCGSFPQMGKTPQFVDRSEV
jgi:hypothetical protein